MRWVVENEGLIRRRLAEERDRCAATVRSLEQGLEQAMSDSSGELSSYDQHAADSGSELFERERDLGLRAFALGTLELIDRAYERLEAGAYGTCQRCGRAIDPERLMAIPYAEECVACASTARDGESPRPVEEEVVNFAETLGDADGEPAYGADVAMEDLARHGTANSPQDVLGAVDYDDLSDLFANQPAEIGELRDPGEDLEFGLDLDLGEDRDLDVDLERDWNRVEAALLEASDEEKERERETWS